MNNPFEVIEARLSSIENLILDLKHKPQSVEPTNQPEQLLTIDEVAILLHLTKPTIYSKISKNELPGVCKQGKRLYFDRQTIIDWIKQGRKKSNAEIEAEANAYLSNNKKGLNYGK
ncbi:helix-turn-helix domain-containing protein [Flavobacterium sp. CBA20B-1]|uniref:helix-turn-helix transcriptional regulator n=1 Tax=unclassified Flavobacterium TaxID=196869 RepID=UPI0022251E10|nr:MULTISPECIES: helix-turn-helix domain-containing protein [unclassified Flavobacterium]WCM42697.1 helix-turn-helix domain-containing protein [Flavobacterium sp. CBA20B-1]